MAENTEEEGQFDATGLDLSRFLTKEELNDDVVEDEIVDEETEEETVDEETEESPDDILLSDETLDETTKESIRELLLKIDGKEVREQLPFDLPPEAEEYMRQKLQMAGVAQKRMQESAETSKRFENFIKEFKGNPEEIMKELGMDSEEFAEAVIERKIQELSKSDEERAKDERDKELETLRKENEAMRREKEEKNLERERNQTMTEITNEIDTAIDAIGGLPKNEFIRQRVASLWHNYIIKDIEVSANEVVAEVHKELNELFSDLIDNVPDKGLESYIGKKNIERLKASRIQKTPETLNSVKETLQKRDKTQKTQKKVNLNDWMRNRSGSLKDMLK
mgnify:CR=1 FL=1